MSSNQEEFEAYLKSRGLAPPPTPPEKDTSKWSAFQYAADQPLEEIGKTLELLGAEGVGKWLREITEMPENYDSATQAFINQQGNEFWFDYEWSYLPRMLMEQSGQLVGSLASRVAGAGVGAYITKSPTGAAVGAFLGPAMFEAIQILGQTVLERAARDDPPRGPDELTWEDWTTAAGTAGIAGALNAIGIKNLPGLNRGLAQAMKQTGKATARELGTETVQSIVQELGSGVGTEEGLRPVEEFTREAFAEGIAGGTLAGGTQLGFSGLQATTTPSEPVDLKDDTWREGAEERVKTQVAERLSQLEAEHDLANMGPAELTEVIKEIGYKIPKIPGETKEQVYNKLVGFLEEDARREEAFSDAKTHVLSVIDEDKVLREERARLDAMSDEELADYVEQQFGTPEAYETWREGKVVGEDKGTETDRFLLAQFGAKQSLDVQKSASIGRMDLREYENYIEDIGNRYTLQELRDLALRYVPRFSEHQVNRQTQMELAKVLVERMASLENQAQKVKTIGREIHEIDWDTSHDERGYQTKASLTEQSDPNLLQLLETDGNAITATVMFQPDTSLRSNPNAMVREANLRAVLFERTGAVTLDENATLEEKIQKGNGELVIAPDEKQSPAALGWLEQKRQNDPQEWSVGSPLSKFRYPTPIISRVQIPSGTLPHMNRGFTNKVLGHFHKNFRPYMPMGLVASRRHRELLGRIRSLDSKAEKLGLDIEQAILASKRKGEIESIEQGDKLFMAFLRKTGAQIPLDEEQRARIMEHQRHLEQRRFDPDVRGNTQENTRIDEELDALEAILAGSQSTPVALAQLPASLKKTALQARKSIDALTTRIIKEIPYGTISETETATLQAGINQYTTRAFAMFEPALGWNPRFTKMWNKEMQTLYKEAITSMLTINEYKPGWSNYRTVISNIDQTETEVWTGEGTRRATNKIDDMLKGEYFKNAYDVAKLPGILRSSGSDDGVSMVEAGKLLAPRWDIPLPLRKLLGEINKPELVTATSLSRITKLIEQANFYFDLKKMNDTAGEMLFSPKKIPGFYDVQIVSNEFNPLDTYWTTKEVAQTLGLPRENDIGTKAMVHSVYDTLVLVPKGLVQLGIIVLSPATQMRNFVGAAMMFVASGYLGKGGFPEAFDSIAHELGWISSYDKEGNLTPRAEKARKTYARAQELGVSNTNVRQQDALGVFSRVREGQYKTLNNIAHALYALKNITIQKPAIKKLAKPEGLTQRLAGGAVGAAVGAGLAGPIGAYIGATLGGIGAGRIVSGAMATYQASDDFFKQAAWGADMIQMKRSLRALDEKSGLEGGLTDTMKLKVLVEYARTLTTKGGKYESNMTKALKNVTDLQTAIEEISAYHVRHQIPNYDYVGRFAQVLREFPLGNFIAFPTEIARTAANIGQITYKQGTFTLSDELMAEAQLTKTKILFNDEQGRPVERELNTRPFLRNAFSKGIRGTGMIVGVPVAAQALGQAVFDIDDEEIEAAAIVGPDYAKNNQIMPLSKMRSKKDGGGYSFLDLDYYLPYTGITKIQTTVINAIRRGEFEGQQLPTSVRKGIVEWAMEYAESYTEISIAPAVQLELLQNRDKDTGKTIYNETDDAKEIFDDVLLHTLKNAGPGAYSQFANVIRAYETGDARYTDWGRDIAKARAISKLGGLAISDTSPKESFGFLIDGIKKQFESFAESNMTKIAFREGPLTKEDVMEQWQDAQDAWFDIQQDLYFQLQYFKLLQLPDEEYEEQMDRLSQLPGVTKKIIYNLEDGVFTPWKIPPYIRRNFEAVIDELKEKQVKAGLPPEDIKRKWPGEELYEAYVKLSEADPPISLLGVTAFPGVREKVQPGFREQ